MEDNMAVDIAGACPGGKFVVSTAAAYDARPMTHKCKSRAVDYHNEVCADPTCKIHFGDRRSRKGSGSNGRLKRSLSL
jgi:hypothetical protein